MGPWIDLHGQVVDIDIPTQPFFIIFWGLGVCRIDPHDSCDLGLVDMPQIQIGNAFSAIPGEGPIDSFGLIRVGVAVKQDVAGVVQQSIGPLQDHACSNDADSRV